MPAKLLESALANTAGCTHCEYDQLRLNALSSQQTIPKTATNPGGRLHNLALDAQTTSRPTMLGVAFFSYSAHHLS